MVIARTSQAITPASRVSTSETKKTRIADHALEDFHHNIGHGTQGGDAEQCKG